jgi:uncharacterized membrane protein YgcG
MKKFLPLILAGVGVLMAFNKPITALVAPASLEIEISKPPVIMPCIYKVYANNDALLGKYSLFKVVIKNTSSVAAKNVEVNYSVTNYIDNALAEKIPLIQPGQTVVVNCYPNFPEKIAEKTTESKETVKIIIKGSNIKTKEESFALPMKGRNDFMYNFMPADEIRTGGDYFENMPLISCLVTPNDPVIKYLNQQIQQKVLRGDLTNTNSEAEGIRFLKGIYNTTLLSDMVYGGTSGVPEKISDVNSIVQNIRLPREVITGRAGLCIELSLLYASIMAAAGMDAIVYLVPGHAYPGFRMNGNVYAIESTAIGGDGIGGRQSDEAAFQMGMKRLKEDYPNFGVDGRYQAVVINDAVKEGAVPMELKDDPELKKKIDEFFNKAGAANIQVSANNPAGAVNMDNGGGNTGGGGDNGGGDNGGGNTGGGGNIPSGYRVYQGAVSFAYPGSWRNIGVPQGFIPQCKGVISNSAGNANVQIYSLRGGTRPDQILQVINQALNQRGLGLQYQPTGQSNGYTIYSGQTGSAQGVLINWYGAFKVTGAGVDGVTIGAYSNTGSTHVNTLNKILNSVQ